MSAAPIRAAFAQAFREAWAGGAGMLLPATFFAGAAMLTPFAVGSDSEQLASIGGACSGLRWRWPRS